MKNSHLMKKNPLYTNTYETMLQYQYAYLGGQVFKVNVRKKRPSEDSVIYLDVITNTVAQPICRYIVDTINDVLFEPGVKRDIQFATPTGAKVSTDNMEWQELFQLDSDLQNRSLTGFMETVGDLTSIFGHCWVAVDMPMKEQGNLGRPYTVAISPLNVWDWEYENYGGRPILKYVKIMEHETDECYYFKCYHLGDATTPSYWQSFEVEKGAPIEKEVELTGEGYYPPGMGIPVFIAYGRRDPRTMEIGISDIDTASDAMREHYKLECEAYQSIQFAKTLIRADNGVKVPALAGAIVRATQGQIESITVDTGDVDKIISKQQDILEQIEALTGLGGLRNTKNQIASGVAIIEERKQLHRMAKAKAREMEVTEEQIWTYAARFMDMRWAGEVVYGTDYEQHDTNYRMAIMKEAKQLVPDNEIINGLIINEMVAMLAPPTETQEYLQAVKPTLGPAMQAVVTEQDDEVYSRDLGSQIPVDTDYKFVDGEWVKGTEQDNGDDGDGVDESNDYVGGGSTTIEYMGASYTPQQAVAIQLSGINTGR
jgi:hypothetical protein